MLQLKFYIVFRLVFFSSIAWFPISILCGHRIVARQSAASTFLDLPPGGLSSGGGGISFLPESQNSPTQAKGSTENDTGSSRNDLYEECITLLSSSKRSYDNPVVPIGSVNNQPETKPLTSGNPESDGSSQASKTSGTIPNSGSQGSPGDSTNSPGLSSNDLPPLNRTPPNVTSKPPVASLPSINTSSSSLPNASSLNVTSNAPLSNSSVPSPNQSSPLITSQQSQGNSVAAANQTKIVIAGCITLAVLLSLGTVMVFLRWQRAKKKPRLINGGSDGSSTLQAKPGEFGKRGTVLAGRGLESRYGLPSSGGWLDTRVASTERLVSVLSSRANNRQAPTNPV